MAENLTDTNVGNIKYINKQDAVDALEAKKDKSAKGDIGCFYNTIIQNTIDALKDLPSADVVQVVHGKWIDEDPAFAEYFANCSVCGYEIDVHNERGYFNFCPNCGAKMDAQGEE